MKQIYILVDCDGEACSAFEDKEEAVEEAQDCGLDVEEIPFFEKE